MEWIQHPRHGDAPLHPTPHSHSPYVAPFWCRIIHQWPWFSAVLSLTGMGMVFVLWEPVRGLASSQYQTHPQCCLLTRFSQRATPSVAHNFSKDACPIHHPDNRPMCVAVWYRYVALFPRRAGGNVGPVGRFPCHRGIAYTTGRWGVTWCVRGTPKGGSLGRYWSWAGPYLPM